MGKLGARRKEKGEWPALEARQKTIPISSVAGYDGPMPNFEMGCGPSGGARTRPSRDGSRLGTGRLAMKVP